MTRDAKTYQGSLSGLQNEINKIVDSVECELVDVRIAPLPSQGQAAVVAVIIFNKL